MNKVIAAQGAATAYQATLQDFKNAFQLKGSQFKTSVDSTKGALYVKDGQLCSANRHGGTGTVKSSVTNLALRNALIDAFQNAGATEEFVRNLREKLLQGSGDADLDRKTVKGFIAEFEKDEGGWRKLQDEPLDQWNNLHMKAIESTEVFEHSLTVDDFRALARGSGIIGRRATDLEEDKGEDGNPTGWLTCKLVKPDRAPEDIDIDYSSLRSQLYRIVLGEVLKTEGQANMSESQKFARTHLVERLDQTLVGKDIKKPLTCDEVRRTLMALDRSMGYVPPKALSDRTIKTSGANKKLAAQCDQYEKKAEEIDALLEKYDAGDVDVRQRLTPDVVKDMRRESASLREAVDVGRQHLRQEEANCKTDKAKFVKIDDMHNFKIDDLVDDKIGNVSDDSDDTESVDSESVYVESDDTEL